MNTPIKTLVVHQMHYQNGDCDDEFKLFAYLDATSGLIAQPR